MGLFRIFLFVLLAASFVGCSPEKQKRLKWNLKTTVEDYEKFGRHDPKWDAQAKEALTLYAEWRANNAMDQELIAKIAKGSQSAVDAGCKDALVFYLYARFVVNRSGRSDKEIAAAHGRASDSMRGSDYASLRKFYAMLRAAETRYKLKPTPKLEVTEIMNDVCVALTQALKDDDAPYGELYSAARALMFIYPKMQIPRNWGWQKLEPLLRKKFGDSYAEKLGASAPVID